MCLAVLTRRSTDLSSSHSVTRNNFYYNWKQSTLQKPRDSRKTSQKKMRHRNRVTTIRNNKWRPMSLCHVDQPWRSSNTSSKPGIASWESDVMSWECDLMSLRHATLRRHHSRCTTEERDTAMSSTFKLQQPRRYEPVTRSQLSHQSK